MTIQMTSSDAPRRRDYLDALRIITMWFIVTGHSASTYMDILTPETTAWQYLATWNSICHWTIGMFVMISGALFLDPDRRFDIKRLYKHNILHIIEVFFFWSLLYTLLVVFTNGTPDTPVTFLAELIKGHYHMWYLYMLVGLYAITPLLRKITADWNMTLYLALVCMVIGFAVPTVVFLRDSLNEVGVPFMAGPIWTSLDTSLANMNLYFPLGCLGQYVLGYILAKGDFTKKQRGILYGLGLFGFLFTLLFPLFTHAVFGKSILMSADAMLNTVFLNIGIFTLCRYLVPAECKPWVRRVSSLILVVYLMHPMVLEILDHPLNINAVTITPFAPAIGSQVLGTIVMAGCLCAAWVFKKIPFVKNFG